jgi:hypothetical protein
MKTNSATTDLSRRLWGPLALAAAVVLVRLPSLSEPGWGSDDGFFTAVALQMSKGVPLYAGVFDAHPPMIYWLYRLLVGLGVVQHHVLTQLVALLATVAVAVLTYAVATRVTQRSTALLAGALAGVVLSIPTLDGDLLNVELLALPLFLGALLLAFDRRPPILVAAGLLLALALATRPSFLFDSVALAVPLLAGAGRVRRIAAVAAGGAAGLAAVAAALWLQGSLGAYVTVVMPANHSYIAWANEGTDLPLYLRLAFLFAVGAALFWRARTPAGRLAVAWLFASVAGSSITPREITHYAHEAIPAISFAVALLVARISRRRLRIPAYGLALVAVAFAAEMVLYLPGVQTSLESGHAPRDMYPNFAWTALPAYYANWFDYAVGARDWAQYSSRFPGSTATDAAEARLLTLTGRAPRLTVIGDRPWLFVDSGATPATRFIATNSAFWQVAGEPAELAGRIRAGCAGVIVYERGSGDWRADLEAGGYRRLPDAPWPTYMTDSSAAACP